MRGSFAEPLQQVDRTYVLWRGRKLTYFGGCDYFRFSSHPAVLEAVQNATREVGVNVAASRRTTGNHLLYGELEEATRQFFGAERAILVSNGYLTNIVVAQGLSNVFGHVLLDERAHSSLRDATKFLSGRFTEFKHLDAKDLQRKLKQIGAESAVAILSDGVFATDGAVAPLDRYRDAAAECCVLWVDDAHGAGVLGERGRGTPEEARVRTGKLIQTITFSKAFGGYGGAILCDRKRAEQIISESSALAGNTPIPLPLAAASLAGLRLGRDNEVRLRLWQNVEQFWTEVGRKPRARSPIISVVSKQSTRLRRQLSDAGIYPSFIQYGGSGGSYFRFALSSEHSPEQISALTKVLANALRAKSGVSSLAFSGLDPESL